MKAPNRKWQFGAVAIVAAIAGFVLGIVYAQHMLVVPSNTGTGKATVVHIGSFSTAIDYAPYLVARSKGWIDEELAKKNARAEYVEFQTLPAINEALAGSKVDFVFEAEPPAIIASAAGNDVKVIALSCTLTVDVIVPIDSEASSLVDLKGENIAVLAGTGAHYGLMSNARTAGLSDSDIVVVDMNPPDAKVAFTTGQVAAWSVWSPWPEQEIVAGTARVLPGTKAPIHSILVVRSSLLQGSDNTAVAVVAAIDRAKEWIIANPDAAQALVAKELNLPLEVVELAWPRQDWSARFTPAVIADFQAKADFLVSQKFIKNSVDVKNLITPLGSSK